MIQTDDHIDYKCGPWRHTFSAQDSERLIATICIALLSFTCFSENQLTIGAGDSNQYRKKISAYTNDHPFLDYAATNWTNHSENARLDNNPKWAELMVSLCTITKPGFQTWYAIYQESDQNRLPRTITSLNLAATFDFTNVLAYLLENGEDPNEQDSQGATPLARASQKSQKAVQRLLDANADINACGWEEQWYDDIDGGGSEMQVKPFAGTPLTMAVVSGDANMVEYLISRGAAINFPPLDSMTPLIASIVCNDSTDLCRQLLCNGANVSFEVVWERETVATTALHIAAEISKPSLLRMLAESETTNINYQTRMIANGVQTEDDDTTGDKPQTGSSNLQLFLNDSEEEEKTNKRIENVDTDAKCENDEEDTISDNDSASDNYRFELNEDDDESGTDSQWSSDDDTDDIGVTALHMAVSARLVENARILLENGADMHIKTARGYTAMDMALNLSDGGNDSDSETGASVKAQLLALLQQYDHGAPLMVSCVIPRLCRMLTSRSVLGTVCTSALTHTAP